MSILRYRSVASLCTFLTILLCSIAPLCARDFSSLQAEVWVDLEPMGAQGPIPRISKEIAAQALIDEARLLFSGMIYGWDFEYRPGDIQRQAIESFSMTTNGQIILGDPNLEFRENRGDDNTVYLRARYFPRAHELSRLEGWSSQHLGDSGGAGLSSYFAGSQSRIRSLENACKEAIKDYARTHILTKPSRLFGRLILMAVPRVTVVSGSWKTEVRVRVQIDEVEKYQNY